MSDMHNSLLEEILSIRETEAKEYISLKAKEKESKTEKQEDNNNTEKVSYNIMNIYNQINNLTDKRKKLSPKS
jgi:hypothetical protein